LRLNIPSTGDVDGRYTVALVQVMLIYTGFWEPIHCDIPRLGFPIFIDDFANLTMTTRNCYAVHRHPPVSRKADPGVSSRDG
jgi:hypothetical protein